MGQAAPLGFQATCLQSSPRQVGDVWGAYPPLNAARAPRGRGICDTGTPARPGLRSPAPREMIAGVVASGAANAMTGVVGRAESFSTPSKYSPLTVARRGSEGRFRWRSGQLGLDGHRYSMTWSARSSSNGGIVRPSAFAVFRLMTSSNFVGCSTGRSAGFAPLRILSTYVAARRNESVKLGA